MPSEVPMTETDPVQLAFDVHEYENTRQDVSPVVLLPGMGWCKRLYRDLARDLCLATQKKVFCLDLRNHGESPASDYITMDIMTGDVKKFLKDQNLKKVDFVCHSFSNTISYTIAIDQPNSVGKLLMIDSPPFLECTEEFNEKCVYPQSHAHNRLLKTFDANMSLADAKKKLYGLSKSTNGGTSLFYYKAAYELTKKNGKFDYKSDLNFMVDQLKRGHFDVEPRGFSDKEILIIRCSNSICVPDCKFDAVKRHNPNAKLLTLEGTTHLLMFEEQDKFIAAAKDFLSDSE